MSAWDESGDPCGCGAPAPGGDAPPENRPGLPAVAYRIGTHPTFLARMLRRIPRRRLDDEGRDLPTLAALTTRRVDDPAIALLDAWAAAADVLTFYQERIANEGFLRTATERRSVRELGRALGYELKPGVAATAYLELTVDTAPGSPEAVAVPAGMAVQSVPVERALPQTFETSSAFIAHAGWNELRPRLTRPQALDTVASSVRLEGRVEVARGAWVCIVTGTGAEVRAVPRQVEGVEHDDVRKTTLLRLASGSAATAAPSAAAPRGVVSSVRTDLAAWVGTMLRESWSERDLQAMLALQGWSARDLVAAVAEARRAGEEGTENLSPSIAAAPGVYLFPVRAGPFGHNAPRWNTLPVSMRYPKASADGTVVEGGDPKNDPPFPESWDGTTEPGITIASQGTVVAGTSTPPRKPYLTSHGVDFFAERVLSEAVAGTMVLLERTDGGTATPAGAASASGTAGMVAAYRVDTAVEASLSDFALSARCTGLAVTPVDGSAAAVALGTFKLRSTTLHAGGRPVRLAREPLLDPVGAGTAEESRVTLDTLSIGLSPGQPLSLSGPRADLPGVDGAEIAVLREAVHQDGLTTLHLEAPLAYRYLRGTLKINANTVRATHGETAREALGSGDGSAAHQAFALRRAPLTHLPAPAAGGAASTLEVWVNEVRWEPAPTLFGLGPADERYQVRTAEDGYARVVFGDGEMGARLPTGAENVHAVYRVGVGAAGMVPAGSLVLMQTRPLGIREVTNPLPASGAEDPEALDDAREHAPLSVLTLDRIVSLRDYEDFAAAFAGVGKARAARLWDGAREIVHLTVADAFGGEVGPGAPLREALQGAVERLRDPAPAFVLDTFRPAAFDLAATLLTDPRRDSEAVEAAARRAVLEAFSFRRRGFGQPVTAAEVVAVLQDVPGVAAVDLDALHLSGASPGAAAPPDAVLPAAAARMRGKTVVRAELLLVNPAGVALAVRPEGAP